MGLLVCQIYLLSIMTMYLLFGSTLKNFPFVYSDENSNNPNTPEHKQSSSAIAYVLNIITKFLTNATCGSYQFREVFMIFGLFISLHFKVTGLVFMGVYMFICQAFYTKIYLLLKSTYLLIQICRVIEPAFGEQKKYDEPKRNAKNN